MELGQKLKQARLDAGLSQRQLCGDTITRNMLSQIENGSANPSLATLQVLSARLGKPLSYFREDAPSENLVLLHRAEQAQPAEAMTILQNYLSPDPILDRWYHLLSCRCCMELAEQAIRETRMEYARKLLAEAAQHNQCTAPWESLFQRQLLLLQYRCDTRAAPALAAALPDNTEEMLLRAQAALETGNANLCLSCLTAADRQSPKVFLLRGDALMQQKAYAAAADCFLALENIIPTEVYSRLEVCYRELGDFQKAYEYACKQR